jgi:hypothetical protein
MIYLLGIRLEILIDVLSVLDLMGLLLDEF